MAASIKLDNKFISLFNNNLSLKEFNSKVIDSYYGNECKTFHDSLNENYSEELLASIVYMFDCLSNRCDDILLSSIMHNIRHNNTFSIIMGSSNEEAKYNKGICINFEHLESNGSKLYILSVHGDFNYSTYYGVELFNKPITLKFKKENLIDVLKILYE